MKKRNLLGSITKACTVASIMAGGTFVFNSCEKDSMTEIKVEDSEDVENTNTEIGKTELTTAVDKLDLQYQEMADKRADSLKHVLDLLDQELEKLTKVQQLDLERQLEELNLADQAVALSLDRDEQQAMVDATISAKQLEIQGNMLQTKLDSAQNVKDMADVANEIAIADAEAVNDILIATEKAMAELASEETMKIDELNNLQNAIHSYSSDSISNAYTILSEISGHKEDSIATKYSLLFKMSDEMNKYIQDTASDNRDLVLGLDGIAKDEELKLEQAENDHLLALLQEVNTSLNEIQAENDEQLVRVETHKLKAEKDLDAAVKAYEDYVASKEALAAEEKTELKIKVYSLDKDGNATLIPSNAKVVLNGDTLDYANGMVMVKGDLEGDHDITVSAPSHLTTQFSFEIADNNGNDEAATFTLYKQHLVVKLLQATETFMVKGNIKANTVSHEFFQIGNGYDYLQETDVFDEVSDADLSAAISKKFQRMNVEDGPNEAVAGLKLTLKVTGNGLTAGDYVSSSSMTITNFSIVNTTAAMATTDENGNYELADLPVLNDDFTVEIAIEKRRENISKILYGQDVTPKQVTKTVVIDKKLTEGTITIDAADRDNGAILFEDRVLF